jgi:hypothetical protein
MWIQVDIDKTCDEAGVMQPQKRQKNKIWSPFEKLWNHGCKFSNHGSSSLTLFIRASASQHHAQF